MYSRLEFVASLSTTHASNLIVFALLPDIGTNTLKIRTIAKFMLTIGLVKYRGKRENIVLLRSGSVICIRDTYSPCAHSSRDYVECLYLSHEALVMISRYFRIFNTIN